MNPNEFPLPARRHSLPSPAVNYQKFAALLGLLFCPLWLHAADPAPPPPAAITNVVVVEPDPQLLRSVLILQEQIRTTQRAVEQAREESQADSKRAAENLTARLNTIEQTLNTQRESELRDLQQSTHKMIIIVGIATAIGFLAMMVTGFLQARAATRLTEVSRQLAALPAPFTSRLTELPAPGALPGTATAPAIEDTNAHLLGAIDRLEHRLEEMETSPGGTQTATNGHKPLTAGAPATPQLATVLSKGQALLNMDQPDEALEQFEEALRLEPRNLEAWIKRGTALERLQRAEDAITSYDQAIAIDASTATAYLFKAGVYNRQKKYAEALQCYEKALHAQQKTRTAAQA